MIESHIQNAERLPFENYPHQGMMLLGRVTGDTCRYGYGLKFMQLTGQTTCAYCGIDLTAKYETWLTMALDHVIPFNTKKLWGLPEEWLEDYTNRVLCCTACNSFDNRYTPKGFQCPSTLEEFYQVRDAIFVERQRNILKKHKQEHAFFNRQPWNKS